MEKKISKKGLDEAIHLTKEYFRTGNRKLFPAINDKFDQVFGEKDGLLVNEIISDTMCMKGSRTEPCETYYKVIEALGYTIDWEDDKKRTGKIMEEEKQK